MKRLNMSKRMYEYYRDSVKNNETITFSQARRKMTRNMLLANKADSSNYIGQMYQYGRLWFVVRDNKIIWMKNKCRNPEGWILDKEKYDELNKTLGIKNNYLEDEEDGIITYRSAIQLDKRYGI